MAKQSDNFFNFLELFIVTENVLESTALCDVASFVLCPSVGKTGSSSVHVIFVVFHVTATRPIAELIRLYSSCL